jgi:hypothetical protein
MHSHKDSLFFGSVLVVVLGITLACVWGGPSYLQPSLYIMMPSILLLGQLISMFLGDWVGEDARVRDIDSDVGAACDREKH